MLRFLTAGESHGPALVVTVEGMPAGLPILVDDVAAELARRRLGYGRGPRMRFEQDELELLGGIRHGRTLGSPIAIVIRNSEWATGKWTDEMASAPGTTAQPLTQPRPGHADLAGMQKYGFTDARDVLERASARETAARVAAGALAKALLRRLGISVLSHVVQLGAAAAAPDRRPGPDDLEAVDGSEVRCYDPDAEAEMIREIKEAAKAGDSLGGVVEVLGFGMPPGLGSHVHWDRRIDGLMLAQALMSIQAMKAVEIGEGLTVAGGRGRHDPRRSHGTTRPVQAGSPSRGGGSRADDDRRSPRGARRDETARDVEPSGVEDGRHRDQGSVGVVQGADRRDRGPPRASSRRPW